MDMTNHLNPFVKKIYPSGIRKFSALANEKEGCISLTLGEPDFDTPQTIKDKVQQSLSNNLTHYPDNPGYEFLRKEISNFEREKNNLDYSPEEVIVTCGATQGLHTVFSSIIENGDQVIIPTPDFLLYDMQVTMNGGECINLNTAIHDFQIKKGDLEAVYTEKTKAIILNSPNNPTGCIYSKETLQVIYEFFKDKPVFIICDEVYSQLVFTEEYISFASFSDLKDRIIIVQSFSKPYAMTGWRVGYIMADKSIINTLKLVSQYTITSIPAFVQTACVQALSYDITEMVSTFKNRRDYVFSRLIKLGLEVSKPEGAFYVFPSIEEFGILSEEFCAEMIEKVGLALTPGSCFGCEGYVRISYCYSDEILVKGMDRLEQFIDIIRNSR